MKKRHSNQEASVALRRAVNAERRKEKGAIQPHVVLVPTFEVVSNKSKSLVDKEIERLVKKQMTSEDGLTLAETKQLEIYMKIAVSVNREERIHSNDQFNELMKLDAEDLEAAVESQKALEGAVGAVEDPRVPLDLEEDE